MTGTTLVDVDDSLLAVVDVQKAFTGKLATTESRPLVARIRWLIQVADWLAVPLVVTAEDIPANGGVLTQVAAVLPEPAVVHNKMVFGLAADPEILAAAEATGRRTAVLVGLETDVCVAQSALGLIEHGYRVVVPSDCVASPGTAQLAGLERMRAAGAMITTAKSLLYEWLRTVERANRFFSECVPAFGVPEGVVL